jgi:sugar-specific transcriptional regulator TrmB
MSSVDHLMRLGLNRNEAKALDALITLGPSGASDVHRQAGIPRNKAYESLEALAARGMVETQQGRPVLYRAIGAKTIIDHLVEEYGSEAKQAFGLLEKKQQELEAGEGFLGGSAPSAWMVRGEQGVRRRLAELIYGAKSDIFGIGGYPPKYLLGAKTALKAAAKRGVKTRAVSMIRPMEEVEGISSDDKAVIEFRTVKIPRTLKMRIQPFDEKIVGGFAGMSGVGGMVIVDEALAFDIVDDGTDAKKVAGIVFKAPGIPSIQKATVERVLALYTRKL